MSLQEYRAFIASRAVQAQMQGFAPGDINAHAKAHQDAVVRFAIERGKSAAFLDTGLGKASSSWSLPASARTKPASRL